MKDAALASKKNKPMIICFHVSYSGSFHLMQPLIADLKDDYNKDLDIVLIEKGKNPNLETKYEINFFPTLLLIWKDQIIIRLHGLVNRAELFDQVDHLLIEIDEKKKAK